MKRSEPVLAYECWDYKKSELLDYEDIEKILQADAIAWVTRTYTPEEAQNFARNMTTLFEESKERPDKNYLRLMALEIALMYMGHPVHSTGRGCWAKATTLH